MPKDADILTFLLALNQTCAAKEAAGEKITPPGLQTLNVQTFQFQGAVARQCDFLLAGVGRKQRLVASLLLLPLKFQRFLLGNRLPFLFNFLRSHQAAPLFLNHATVSIQFRMPLARLAGWHHIAVLHFAIFVDPAICGRGSVRHSNQSGAKQDQQGR